jgi:hypothetical protein
MNSCDISVSPEQIEAVLASFAWSEIDAHFAQLHEAASSRQHLAGYCSHEPARAERRTDEADHARPKAETQLVSNRKTTSPHLRASSLTAPPRHQFITKRPNVRSAQQRPGDPAIHTRGPCR